MSLDLIGAVDLSRPRRVRISVPGTVISIAAGVAGAAAWRAHPVLGFLGASALASNAYGLATRDRTWKQAAERMGRHVVATAGSLALPAYPALGWMAGALAADLLIDEEDGGIIAEWVHHVDEVKARRRRREIEAEVIDVEPDHETKTLVPVTQRKAA